MENNNNNANDNKDRALDLLGLANYRDNWLKQHQQRSPAMTMEDEAKPSQLNTLNSSGLFQQVSLDKMSVQYVGAQQHGYDVGAVQADRPAPTKKIAYYFEMIVKNAGEKGQVAIGFTSQDYNLRRQPGWEANSCGYNGDDGFIYRGQEQGESFGPKYTTGDTVGAGINYASQEFFFTKNGKLVGTIEKDIKGPLYPTISVHSQNEEVTVNFGERPFLFDIKAFRSEERLKQQKLIEKLSLPPNVSHWLMLENSNEFGIVLNDFWPVISKRIIRSYLLHYGYQDTLNSFEVESESSSLHNPASQENGFNEQGDAYALNHRKILRQLIRKGDIDSAFRKLRDWYPQVVQGETSSICFLLHSQRFIEYIRDDELLEGVSYARAELNKFLKVEPFEGMLEDAIALLAYDVPAKSCVGYLLKQSHREFVADAVNAVILATNPNMKSTENCMYSCLEKLLRQLTACIVERRALNENQGEAFDLHREQLRWGWKTLDE